MFDEDLSTFFDSDEFAVGATLAGVPVQGILRPGFDAAPIEGFGTAAGTSPTFSLPSNQVPVKPEGKALQVLTGPGAAHYLVSNARHDGTGVCELSLYLNRTP